MTQHVGVFGVLLLSVMGQAWAVVRVEVEVDVGEPQGQTEPQLCAQCIIALCVIARMFERERESAEK